MTTRRTRVLRLVPGRSFAVPEFSGPGVLGSGAVTTQAPRPPGIDRDNDRVSITSPDRLFRNAHASSSPTRAALPTPAFGFMSGTGWVERGTLGRTLATTRDLAQGSERTGPAGCGETGHGHGGHVDDDRSPHTQAPDVGIRTDGRRCPHVVCVRIGRAPRGSTWARSPGC